MSPPAHTDVVRRHPPPRADPSMGLTWHAPARIDDEAPIARALEAWDAAMARRRGAGRPGATDTD